MTLKIKAQQLQKIADERIGKFFESDKKFISDLIQDIKDGYIVDIRDTNLTKTSQLLFVEEGSIDNLDTLTEILVKTNPEIRIIVYKRGSTAPILQHTTSRD